MEEGTDVNQMQNCEKCGMLVTDGKCVGCDMAPADCTCPVQTEEVATEAPAM